MMTRAQERVAARRAELKSMARAPAKVAKPLSAVEQAIEQQRAIAARKLEEQDAEFRKAMTDVIQKHGAEILAKDAEIKALKSRLEKLENLTVAPPVPTAAKT